MFFILSKVGYFFLQPSNFLVAFGVFGLVLGAFGFRRSGRVCAALSLLLLLFIGLSPAANWIMMPLEQRFPLPEEQEGLTGIIVLGGAFSTRASENRPNIALNESAERLTIVPYLARLYPHALIVHSGGNNHLNGHALVTEADGAKRLFKDFGIAPDRILLEGKSRNTRENAVFTKRLLGEKADGKWLLVTSAYHMPRAMGVFREAGFKNVIAYPVDYRVVAVGGETTFFSGVSSGLLRFDTAFREWLGLLVYWATGLGSSLFPAP